MEGCITAVQVTPQVNSEMAFSSHILWAPKKKRAYRRMTTEIPSGARVHSKIRKRLVFTNVEDHERKVTEEVSSNTPEKEEEFAKVLNDCTTKTPDCSDANGKASLQLNPVLEMDLRVEQLKNKQNGVRNSEHQRIKRKLALSSFR